MEEDKKAGFDAEWAELAAEVLSGVKERRLQHPKATLREIEQVLDEYWAMMRVRLMQDAALASAAAEITAGQAAERPKCPECGPRWRGVGRRCVV